MLALLAALVLSPKRVLPEPFISTPLLPVLPVDALAGSKPHSIARGNVWRQGGLVRLTYYFRFEPRKGPTHRQVMVQPGFTEEIVSYGGQISERAFREHLGIRQSVRILDVDEGTYWPWAQIVGPARVAIVTETPTAPVPAWHRSRELQAPPLPPNFPPPIAPLRSAEVIEVRTDPLIPRSFRTTVGMYVRIASQLHPHEFAERIGSELPEALWTTRRLGTHTGFGLKKTAYGLYSIDVDKYGNPDKRFQSEATLAYLFDDSANAPRLID